MTMNVAELSVETLVRRGVERVYGLLGDSLNGITDANRAQKKIQSLSPVSLRELDDPKIRAGFTQEDRRYLQFAGEVLADQTEFSANGNSLSERCPRF